MNDLVHSLDYRDDPMTNSMLSNLSTGILFLDVDLKVLFCNQAVESLLQESHSQLRNNPLSDSIANSDELEELATSAVQSNQLITKRNLELLLPGRDNVIVDITVTPIMESDQVLIELIAMDRYLRINRDAAIKEHHEVTRQMVRSLAHEIKNPLGGIKGSAQLLEKELSNPDLSEYTSIIIEETDRLTTLVDRMLGPRNIPQPRSTNIHEILERAAKLVELEASKSLIVSRDYDPSIPELNLDPELMLQALLNVTRNAMQILTHTPHPSITLSTRIERQFTISGTRHKVVLRIDIRDNGPGIPAEIQEHLFYPMISAREGGTGLGLTFAHSIINQHSGLIDFESSAGETTFSIFIPLNETTARVGEEPET